MEQEQVLSQPQTLFCVTETTWRSGEEAINEPAAMFRHLFILHVGNAICVE